MKLHHIGIATKDVEATTSLLEYLGYHAGNTAYDENQNVNVRFLYSDVAPTVELLFGGGQRSSVDSIIEKNGTSVYHLCYETEDMDKTVSEMRDQGYIPIGTKKESLIDGKKVLFLYHIDNVMIELLEE